MQYPEQGIRVGPSSCGLGVFALQAFALHDRIGPIRGTVIEDPSYESDYCMELGDHCALEPDSPFRFVNHSCHPNCELVEVTRPPHSKSSGHGILWLEVLDEILAGEQLTIDYAWPACVAIPCNCGSAGCRGWIVAEEDSKQVTSPAVRLLALKRTPQRHRHHVWRLYRLWMKWNVKFFAGRLTVPQIALGRFRKPGSYGDCGPASDPGSLSRIRLQLSLLTGTHPHLRSRPPGGRNRYRLVAEVLLHEMVHQWGREVAGGDSRRWRRHGASFCQKCNEIGRQLRLLPVSTAVEAERNPALISCTRWPHNARRRKPAVARRPRRQTPS